MELIKKFDGCYGINRSGN